MFDDAQWFPRQPIQFGGGQMPYRRGSGATTLEFVTSDSTDRLASSSPFTFSAKDIGAAHVDRVVIVAVGVWTSGGVTPAVSGVTIGGASATQIVDRSAGVPQVYIYALAVPSDTTADIVVSFSAGTPTTCAIGVYRMVKLGGGTTAYHTDNNGTTSSTSLSNTLNVPDDGVALYATMSENGSDPSYNSGGGLSKSLGIDARSNEWFAGAHGQGLSAATGATLTFTQTPTGRIAGVSASWE